MPALEPEVDAETRSDSELILAVREGDNSAIDELYRRHHRAALCFAVSVAGDTLAPDLVSDAFLRIFDLLQRGGGPNVVFRSYLYTTVRNLYVDHVRHHARQTSLPDFGTLEAELAHGDGLDDRFEQSVVKRAFNSLPARWQTALWYTTVEGVTLEDASTYLDVAPNAVAALTFRAREGLRQAYLAEHLSLVVDETCAEVWDALPRYVRGTLRKRMRGTVEEHLPSCRRCTEAVGELGEVNSGLRGVLLLALLGAGTAGYLDRALAVAPQGAGVSAGASVVGQVPGLSRTVRAATAVGAAAAAGALVLAWPQQHDRVDGADRPTTPSIGVRDRQAQKQTTPQISDHPGPRTGARNRATTALSTDPAAVLLGEASSVRLTAATPPWYHLAVPVNAGSGARSDLVLIVDATSWHAFHVHREIGFGAWQCVESSSAAGSGHRLICHLPSAAGSFDLGLDVQVAGTSTVTVTARRAGAEVAKTEVVLGNQP